MSGGCREVAAQPAHQVIVGLAEVWPARSCGSWLHNDASDAGGRRRGSGMASASRVGGAATGCGSTPKRSRMRGPAPRPRRPRGPPLRSPSPRTCAWALSGRLEAAAADPGGGVPGVGEARDLDDVAGVRRVDELAAADVDAGMAEPVEEDEIAGPGAGSRETGMPMPYCDAAWCGSETPTCAYDVHDEAGAVEARWARAAPDVGDAEVLERDRRPRPPRVRPGQAEERRLPEEPPDEIE